MKTRERPSPPVRAILEVVLGRPADFNEVADNVKGGNTRRARKIPRLPAEP